MCNLTRIYVLTYAHSRSLSRGAEIAQFLIATVVQESLVKRWRASETLASFRNNNARARARDIASKCLISFVVQSFVIRRYLKLVATQKLRDFAATYASID